MAASALNVLLFALVLQTGVGKFLHNKQPQDAFGSGAVGTAMDDDTPARLPGYRNAWDDCGGVGASATERMRSIAAGIKGFAKDIPFVRHAAQDCGTVDASGLKTGPGTGVVYPGPVTWQAASDGLLTADLALEKFGV